MVTVSSGLCLIDHSHNTPLLSFQIYATAAIILIHLVSPRALGDQLEGNEEEHVKYRSMVVHFIHVCIEYYIFIMLKRNLILLLYYIHYIYINISWFLLHCLFDILHLKKMFSTCSNLLWKFNFLCLVVVSKIFVYDHRSSNNNDSNNLVDSNLIYVYICKLYLPMFITWA